MPKERITSKIKNVILQGTYGFDVYIAMKTTDNPIKKFILEDKIKSLDESKLEDTWNSLDSMKDYLQTNITRNQYLKFIKLIRKVDFSDEDIIQLSGSDQEGEIHDEFYPDETELKKLIIQLFYEKCK